MYAFHLFISADPYLGRLDYSLLSDQALMEMLIEGFDEQTKKTYQDKHGMYLDVCEWSCIECDDDGRVVEVDIGITDMSGSLELFYVPPKVQELYVGSGHKSDLTGSVELEHLPVGVYVLILTNNRLTGEIDLPQLPDGMQILDLKNNQLTGSIDLTHLPDGMRIIYLQNNQLTGEINLTHLPDGMQKLFLQNNQLSGSLVLKRLTAVLHINVQENNFNAVAVVESETRAYIMLRGSGVTSVVDENGKELDSKRFSE